MPVPIHTHTHTRVHWPFIQVQERVEGSAQKEPPGPRPQGRGRQTSSEDKESPPQRLLPGQKVHPSSQHPPGEEVVTLLRGCAWHPPRTPSGPGGTEGQAVPAGRPLRPAGTPTPHTQGWACPLAGNVGAREMPRSCLLSGPKVLLPGVHGRPRKGLTDTTNQRPWPHSR